MKAPFAPQRGDKYVMCNKNPNPSDDCAMLSVEDFSHLEFVFTEFVRRITPHAWFKSYGFVDIPNIGSREIHIFVDLLEFEKIIHRHGVGLSPSRINWKVLKAGEYYRMGIND